jgi:hypothetical protein
MDRARWWRSVFADSNRNGVELTYWKAHESSLLSGSIVHQMEWFSSISSSIALPLLTPIFLLVLFLSWRFLRVRYYRRKLGKRWVREKQRGRETWKLMTEGGNVLDKVRQTSSNRWRTEWGREFDDLPSAARWVESKHSGQGSE